VAHGVQLHDIGIFSVDDPAFIDIYRFGVYLYRHVFKKKVKSKKKKVADD